MSMSGETQVRQFYVMGDYPAHATITALRAGTIGDLAALKPNGTAVANDSEILFALKNYKGQVSLTDVINPSRVLYAHAKKYVARINKSVAVTAIPVVANELYSLSIPIAGYGSLSLENEYIKEGFYKSITGDTVENIVDGLIQSLARNFSREQPSLSTTTEYWKKGKVRTTIQDNVAFSFAKTTSDGVAEQSTIQLTVKPSAPGTATVDLNGVTINVPMTVLASIALNTVEITTAINAVEGYTATDDGIDTVTIISEYPGDETDIATWAAGTATAAAATLVTTVAGVAGTLYGITITEKNWLPEYYVTGKKDRLFLDFKVNYRFPGTTSPTVTVTVGNAGQGTGYAMRNLEWYLSGNRRDSFRQMGYPHNFEEHYDTTLTGEYHILDIGYYDESRDDPMKSKKQITIVSIVMADINLVSAELNKSLNSSSITVNTLS